MDRTTIMNLTVTDLKERLSDLNLTVTGKKAELQKRLLQHLGLVTEHGSSEDESVFEDSENPNMTKQEQTVTRSFFTLRDIIESLNYFDGSEQLDLEQWIDNFESNALTVGWDEIQKFVYAKQMLKGAALLFVKGQPNINSWYKLKKALAEEFSVRLSSAEIHKILSNTYKKASESYIEFLYKIINIAKGSNIDDKSIIEYYIDGLKGAHTSKAILYEAENIEQLKQKIKIFEKIQHKQDSDRKRIHNQSRSCYRCPHLNNHSSDQCKKLLSCENCNKIGHKIQDCKAKTTTNTKHNQNDKNYNSSDKSDSNKDKNQNQFGPNKNKCPSQNYKKSSTSTHSAQKTDINPNYKNNSQENRIMNNNNNCNKEAQVNFCNAAVRVYKTVEIAGRKFSAYLDLGSDICLLTKSVYDSLQNVMFFDEKIPIIGIGGGKMNTLGYIITKMKIEDLEVSWIFHVVNDEDIISQAVIGNDMLNNINMTITKEKTIFKLREDAKSLDDLLFNKMLDTDSNNKQVFTLCHEYQNLCLEGISALEEENYEYLSSNNRNKLISLIAGYKPDKIKETPIKLRIILDDESPIYDRPRRIPIEDQKIVEKQTSEWLQAGIIKVSNSRFAAPIVLVTKKDGSKRLCCDYRRINNNIIRDNFPMVLIDDVILKLQSAKIFSTLDLKNGFFHVAVEEDSQKYTSFITHHGQFEFLRTPFGLKNSPAIFCRYISHVFHELIQNNTIVVYMDDIVIHAQSEEENLNKLEKVLKIAQMYGLEINFKKCQFLKKEISFLGYIIKNSSIKPSIEKTKAVANFKEPSNVKSLQRFLGLTSYFRRFIENYAIKARPLTKLLTKNTKFKIEEEQQIAIADLKQALITSPVLQIFNPNAETEVHTDASSSGYGAVLLQKNSQDQKFHPVEYMSRKTTITEEKYHSYELEVLAIIQALKKWRVFLLGIHFKIVTDCNAFTQTIKKKEVPAKIARWILFLQDFDYKIEHRPSSRLKHADALSRVYSLMMQNSMKHKITQLQKTDENIAMMRKLLETQTYKDYYIKNDIVYKNPEKEQIVIPMSLETEIINLAHKQGHFGIRKTSDLIEKNFYIKNLTQKVDDHIKNCIECIMINKKEGKQEGLLHPIDKAHRPLHTFHLDHVGPMEATKKQYNYILTVVDAFSKFVWIFPTKSTTSEEVVDRLDKIASTFGHPERIVTDRGTAFTANLFKTYCQENGIEHVLTTTGHPRGNGQVERIHKIIMSIMAKLCLNNKSNWYKHVNKIQQVINNSVTRSTKLAPFKILTGLDMKTPENIDFKNIIEEEALQEEQEKKDEIRRIARTNIQKIQNENKKYFDKNRKLEKSYEIDDLVAIKRTQFGAGLKLKPMYLGPYKIVGKKSMGRYTVKKLGESEGPNTTSTTAEFMKRWNDSGANHFQGGRM